MAKKFKTPITLDELGSASSQAIAANVDGDSQNRINIDAGGKITWGSGSATGDTTLYRDSADTLKTDDAFTATSLAVTDQFTLPTSDGSTSQVLQTNGAGTISWVDITAYATVSDTAPGSPSVGQIWYESDTGKTFVYYDSFWIEVGASPPASPFITDLDEDTKIQVEESSDEDKIRFDTAGSERMIIDELGKVGIGTTSPAGNLHVLAGSSGVTNQNPAARLIIEDSDTAGIAINTTNTGNGYLRFVDPDSNSVGGLSYDHSTDLLAFRTSGSDEMVIASSGNVGIGTTSPQRLLDIRGASNPEIRMQSTDSSNPAIYFGDQVDAVRGGIRYDTANDRLEVQGYNNNTRIAVDSSGIVGIGTTSPGTQPGTNGLLYVESNGIPCNFYYDGSSTSYSGWKVYSNVGGTQTLQALVRSNGDFESRTNTYGATSDVAIKQDIVDAPSQWDDIKAVQLRKYRLIDDVATNGDDALVQLGVVAQELEAAGLGGLVVDADPDNDKPHKSVKYSVLLLKALGALQEAMARIEALEAN